MKTIHEAAIEFAVITEDRWANSSKSYDKIDMYNAYKAGAEWYKNQIEKSKIAINKDL